MAKHLRYCMYMAPMDKHPQTVMRELGIKYQHSTPQSMADQWWFWNCEVPAPVVLPGFLSELKIKPHDAIGNGLNKAMADRIAAWEDDHGEAT